MSETTTTDVVPESATGAEAQPEAPVQAAEAPAEETQPDPQGEQTAPDIAETDDHLEWLKNKGIDPEDPDALKKAAETYRKAEQEFHKSRQEAKNQLRDEALNAVTTDDEIQNELNQSRVFRLVTSFYQDHPDAKELDKQMGEIVKAKPYLAGDLEAVYAIASADKLRADVKAAETRGREAAKADIARSSTAAMPKGNASGSTPKEPEDPGRDAFRKELGLD